jgi:hypothetical protein
MDRGAHQSAKVHREFLYEEMADMVDKAQWIVLPYSLVDHYPELRISPIGVIPQHERRPRTIVDYTFLGVNADTVPLCAPEAMQFGRALLRVRQRIIQADPRHGPVHLIKVDVADGFYRIGLNSGNVIKMGVAMPASPTGEPLIAFPLALPMGWVNSPPLFVASSSAPPKGPSSGAHRSPPISELKSSPLTTRRGRLPTRTSNSRGRWRNTTSPPNWAPFETGRWAR